MFPVENKVAELIYVIVGAVLMLFLVIFTLVLVKTTDKGYNDNEESMLPEYSDIKVEIDWGYIVDKKDYVSEDKGEVYLLTFEQIIDGKKYQRTDRVTQSTYDKFTIGDKYYRARYTEDGIKTFEERGNKDDSLYSNG